MVRRNTQSHYRVSVGSAAQQTVQASSLTLWRMFINAHVIYRRMLKYLVHHQYQLCNTLDLWCSILHWILPYQHKSSMSPILHAIFGFLISIPLAPCLPVVLPCNERSKPARFFKPTVAIDFSYDNVLVLTFFAWLDIELIGSDQCLGCSIS